NAFQISTTYRLDQLEKKTRSLEESLALLGQKQLSLEKVSDHLVKTNNIKIEVVEKPVIEVSKDIMRTIKIRRKDNVAERYAAWEKLDRAGVRASEIAKAFKCDHDSVLYAKRNGFKSGWMARSERKGLEA
ncbi:MAG: hypothetical protein EBZ49_10805, partial [Proteobacteria bacterium]|nr:hypothetical protein [Pseudomonadota bacterium]